MSEEVEAKSESSVERPDAIVSDGVTSLFSRGKIGGPGIDGYQTIGSSWINCSMSFSFPSDSWESLLLFTILFLESRPCVICKWRSKSPDEQPESLGGTDNKVRVYIPVRRKLFLQPWTGHSGLGTWWFRVWLNVLDHCRDVSDQNGGHIMLEQLHCQSQIRTSERCICTSFHWYELANAYLFSREVFGLPHLSEFREFPGRRSIVVARDSCEPVSFCCQRNLVKKCRSI